MRPYPALMRVVSVLCLLFAGAFGVAFGAQPPHKTPPRKVAPRKTVHRARVSRDYGDPGKGDVTEFDDPIVREVAVEALGHEKGSVVAVDPSSGRILTIVNQQMAFSSGFEPCSTIKPFIALAALQEGVITSDTMIRVKRGRYMNLTEAMAHSNNEFFQQVGTQLGFDQEIKYERLLGLGDRVGYNIPEEQPGALPKAPPIFGGVARMSSFGSGIRITPFQLASLASTLANGGTQYYLQYPRTETDRQNFESRVRGQLDIAPMLSDVREGMLAAVMYGTAKRSFDPDGEQDLGKTGTCNDENMGGRLGWFVSYADQAHPKIVIVVLLHGGSRVISGPHASQIAGRIYHTLYQRNYFVDSSSSPSNATSAVVSQTDSTREAAGLAPSASR